MRISDFEWDEGNALHLELGHGIERQEVEEVFVNKPLFRVVGQFEIKKPELPSGFCG